AVPVRLIVLLLSFVAAGCSTTHVIERSDPQALARLNEDLRGREIAVVLDSARAQGRFILAAPDTTRWRDGDGVSAAATAEIRSLVVDPRRRNVTTGALVGVGLGALSSIGLCSELQLPTECYAIAIPVGALGGAVIFGTYGYLGSERIEYRLVE